MRKLVFIGILLALAATAFAAAACGDGSDEPSGPTPTPGPLGTDQNLHELLFVENGFSYRLIGETELTLVSDPEVIQPLANALNTVVTPLTPVGLDATTLPSLRFALRESAFAARVIDLAYDPETGMTQASSPIPISIPLPEDARLIINQALGLP